MGTTRRRRPGSGELKTIALVMSLSALAVVLLGSSAGAAGPWTRRANVRTGGAQADMNSNNPSISATGRFVAFNSDATNLVANDLNGVTDVFVHDRKTRKTTRVSVDSGGTEATGGPSGGPSISSNGRYVAFSSGATNLVANDSNGRSDVFVHDRKTRKTTRVSVGSGVTQATGGHSGGPSITADGRFVAFDSGATDLVADDTNGRTDVFIHDRTTGKTKRLSIRTGGAQAIAGNSYDVSVSEFGRYVVFGSDATNLVDNDTNDNADIFIRDRKTGKTSRVSVRSSGGQALGDDSFWASVSSNGRYVTFDSGASNLVPHDTNDVQDVFVHDRATRKTSRVSVGTGGNQANDRSFNPAMSASGRYIAYESGATNLVAQDTNTHLDVFLFDRVTKKTKRVSVRTGGAQATGGASGDTALSPDGRYVGFRSTALNLVGNDTNGIGDIFTRGPLH